MSRRVTVILLFLILSLASAVRIYDLDSNPPGFFADEAAIGFNAYSILKTGRDEYGVKFPLFFQSFGDYRLPLPIYLEVPSIFLFGLSHFSVRFTAAIFGILTVLLLFLLVKEVFGENEGLLASFLLAISPWHIHFSRTAWECIYFPFFLLLGFYFFVRAVKRKIPLWPSFLVFALTLYTYYPAWLVTPLFSLGLLAFYRHNLRARRKEVLVALMVFLAMSLPLLNGFRDGRLLTRWQHVSIFSEQKLSLRQMIFSVLGTYVAHFSRDFLFQKGDIDFPGHFITRHSVRGMGQLYLFEAPLLILGVFLFLKKLTPAKSSILWLLLLYPLGSSLANSGPTANRSIVGIIPFVLISGLSLSFLIQNLKVWFVNKKLAQRFVLAATAVLISFSFLIYLERYFREYPLYSADYWGWQFGPRDVMKYFKTQTANYDDLILSGEFNAPTISLKFYDPKGLCSNCRIGDLNLLDSFKHQLFALKPHETPEDLPVNVKRLVFYPEGSVAFEIFEVR